MIYDYVNTKPPLEEVYDELKHGWLRDAANAVSNKVHKYIKKYKNAKGNWIYQYYRAKSKRAEAKAKSLRDKNFITADQVTADISRTPQQRKKWIKSGRTKAYKTRRGQIATGRLTAHTRYSNDPYRVRKSQISNARQNARNKTLSKAKNAQRSYVHRMDQVKSSRKLTNESNTQQKKWTSKNRSLSIRRQNRMSNLVSKAKNANYWRIRRNADSAKKRRKYK